MGALLETTSIGRSTIIAGWVFTIIAFIAVLIQAFICLWVRRRFGLEDLLLHVSFVLSITLQSLTTRAVFSQGQGQHIWHESRAQLEAVAQVSEKWLAVIAECALTAFSTVATPE